MLVGSLGVTGPCKHNRVISRCQLVCVPCTFSACVSIRFFDPTTSAGPIVAAFGGTALKSPAMPNDPCSEFCAKVNGDSVQIRGPIFNHSSNGASNSGASGSTNATCPVHPGPL